MPKSRARSAARHPPDAWSVSRDGTADATVLRLSLRRAGGLPCAPSLGVGAPALGGGTDGRPSPVY